MKITISHLIAADRFLDRCGLSFINNAVNGILKIYLRYKEKQCLEGSSLKQDWSLYVKQKDGASCAFGMIPVIGSIFIMAMEKYNEVNGDHVWTVANIDTLEEFEIMKPDAKEQASYSNAYSAFLQTEAQERPIRRMEIINKIRMDQRYKLNLLELVEQEAEIDELPLEEVRIDRTSETILKQIEKDWPT